MDNWPICTHKNCDNEVNPKRVAAGHDTCVELHGASKQNFVVVPVPKSNGVVGRVEDLIGIAGSHKGSTMSSSVSGTIYKPNYVVRVLTGEIVGRVTTKEPSLCRGISDQLAHAIKTSKLSASGDLYVQGDERPAIIEGYKLGLLTSNKPPCRLTARAKVLRNVLLQGRQADLDSIK